MHTRKAKCPAWDQSVPNARSEATMNGHATNVPTATNGAISPSKAGGVKKVRTSRTQNLSWVQ